MRICHIITRLLNGGADENTILTCNQQVQLGHEILLVYGNESHSEILDKVDPQVKTLQLLDLRRAVNPFLDIKATFEILRVLRDFQPEVLHTHTSKAGILGRICGRIINVAVIIHGVHILPFMNVGKVQQIVYVLAERWVSRWTDHYICVSDALMRENIQYGVANRDKHSVVASGMDIQRYKEAKKMQWDELIVDLPAASKYNKSIVYVGALETRKRQCELLNIFKEVNVQHPDTFLVLVGGGKDYDRIKECIAMLNLESNVFLTGFRDDVELFIKSSDICVLASEREGLARVLVQYGLAGRPIVTTQLPGVEVVVRHNKNGYIVPADSLDKMVGPICSLLADDEKREHFSRASSQIDFTEWSLEKMVRSIESIYKEVLELKRSSIKLNNSPS